MKQQFNTFSDFYPFYLSQHQNRMCRKLHFIGSCLVLLLLVIAVLSQAWWLCWFIPVVGYGFAWLGHFMFEHNRPATFQYPLYSLIGDWVMFAQMLSHFARRKSPH